MPRRRSDTASADLAIALLFSFMRSSNSPARVVQHLRVSVAALPVGAQLPSVRELMDRLAVGPGTVREAFAALTAEGLIEAHPGRGTFVAPRPSGAAAGGVARGDFG